MKLEKYRQTLKRRRAWAGLCFGFMALTDIALRTFVPGHFFNGFVRGMLTAFQLLLVYMLCADTYALRHEDKLKAMCIREQDERERAIREKLSQTALVIIIPALAAGAMVAGYFSRTVLYTLLAEILALSALVCGLKLYYRRKL